MKINRTNDLKETNSQETKWQNVSEIREPEAKENNYDKPNASDQSVTKKERTIRPLHFIYNAETLYKQYRLCE